MKYKALLHILRLLIYLKRGVWWIGRRLGRLLDFALAPLWRRVLWLKYKITYGVKSRGLTPNKQFFLKRDFLQLLVGAALLCLALPETTLFAKPDPSLAGHRTLAYRFLGPEQEYDLQEIVAGETPEIITPPSRFGGALHPGTLPSAEKYFPLPDQTSVVAGGTALLKPHIMPGATFGGNTNRTQILEYVVEPGDSLGAIAYQFSVSVATILWENKLTERSIIRPGDILRIPPATGVMHTVARGDTLAKIAKRYGVTADTIIAFNNLKQSGTDLIIGERIMVPGGVKPNEQALARAPRTSPSFSRVAAVPRSSTAAPSAGGFVWPSGARTITQYFSWRHHAIDVAGPWQTAIYAAKAGTVEKSQCGWNGGYGCYVIIDHGGGLKTLYGHHSVLLVSPGERVDAGQSIALMGNTGNVRGHTGIHLHFEIIRNGVRVNPLGYVR